MSHALNIATLKMLRKLWVYASDQVQLGGETEFRQPKTMQTKGA